MELLRKCLFIVLLPNIVIASSYAKCVYLSNQKCEIKPTFINLHPNKYSQKLHYYPFMVKLDNALEVVTLLITYPTKYVFQIKQKT